MIDLTEILIDGTGTEVTFLDEKYDIVSVKKIMEVSRPGEIRVQLILKHKPKGGMKMKMKSNI